MSNDIDKLNPEDREKMEQGLTAPKITPEIIEKMMEKVTYSFAVIEGTTATICTGMLDGEFMLDTAYSACVDPSNFDPEFGQQVALQKCMEKCEAKLWELEGYYLWKMIKIKTIFEASKAMQEAGMLDSQKTTQ